MTDPTIQRWVAGERRLERLDDLQRMVVERVLTRLGAELRRRLGSTFTSGELIELYDRGTDWCFDLATEIAPGLPEAWDARVFDAAFARYVTGAADFAGGRQLDR